MFRRPFRILRANLRPYLVITAIVYGAVAAGMIAGVVFPELTAARIEGQDERGTTDLVTQLLASPWLFAVTILGVNLLHAVGLIVLPSLIVPFAGVVVFTVQSFLMGVTLAPTEATAAWILLPHLPTILIEFQAYALVMLGAYVLGRAWMRPTTVDASNRRIAYRRGLRQAGWIALPALALFLVGAAYEAFELTVLVPWIARA